MDEEIKKIADSSAVKTIGSRRPPINKKTLIVDLKEFARRLGHFDIVRCCTLLLKKKKK